MFALGRFASRNPLTHRRRRPGQRAQQKYRPRLERLEGRALPSVTRLTLDIPVVETFRNLTVNFTVVLQIDFTSNALYGGGAGFGGNYYNAGSVTARPVTPSQPAQPPIASPVSQVAPTTPDALRSAVVPTETSEASLASFTSTAGAPAGSANSAAVASRPIIARPSLPELHFSQTTSINVLSDPLLLNPVLPLDFNKILAPELKILAPVNPPVQAIVNRMEFIGGSTSSSDDAVVGEIIFPAPAPTPQPIAPPPVDLQDLTPAAPALDAALTKDAWLIEKADLGMLSSQESDAQTLLTPELVSEVAALAAGMVGFSVGSPADYFPGRQARNRLELKALANKWKNLLWGQKP